MARISHEYSWVIRWYLMWIGIDIWFVPHLSFTYIVIHVYDKRVIKYSGSIWATSSNHHLNYLFKLVYIYNIFHHIKHVIRIYSGLICSKMKILILWTISQIRAKSLFVDSINNLDNDDKLGVLCENPGRTHHMTHRWLIWSHFKFLLFNLRQSVTGCRFQFRKY